MKTPFLKRLREHFSSKETLSAGIILTVMLINMSFGFPRLLPYSAVDEPYWTFERTPDFWRALADGKWKNTDINDKPGVTVAAISGVGLLTIDPMQYKSLREKPKTPEELDAMNTIHIAFRLPIYLLSLLSLPLFYFLIRKSISRSVALIATASIGLSPIILGISLIINPDSLLWIFLPLAILARLTHSRSGGWKYLILAGALTGLSLLTKYVANILFVFFLVLPFIEYIFAPEKPKITSFLKQALRDFSILVAIAIATFTALFPATWVKPEMILEGTLLSAAFKSTWSLFALAIVFLTIDAFVASGKITGNILSFLSNFKRTIFATLSGIFLAIILFTLGNTWLGMQWFDFEEIVMSPKNSPESATLVKSIGHIGADAYSLLFGLHPILLFFLLAALIFSLFGKLKNARESTVIASFTLFILLYYAGSEANYVIATVRYQIAIFPLTLIIASLGAVTLFEHLRIRKYSSARHRLLTLFLFIALLAGSLFVARPHYLAYSSSLLPETYILNYKDMGDGSFEAARYLNALPNAKDLRIWSDKGAVCAVFAGNCSVSFNEKRFLAEKPDYLVISTGRKRKTVNMWLSRDIPIRFKDAYEFAPADFVEIIDGRPDNFVKVINIKNVWQEKGVGSSY